MISVRVTTNMVELQRSITLLQRDQLPSVMRNALNDTAMEARDAERGEIARVFDRPNSFTRNSVVFPKPYAATKENLSAAIIVRDEASKGTPPSKYLVPEVLGGGRRLKSHERALRRVGLLGPNEYTVPARGYPLNAYGNIPGSRILEILSQLKAAETSAGYLMNETKRSRKRAGAKRTRRYFVPRRGGGLPPGVYERTGNRIRGVLMFVSDAPTYRPRFPLGVASEKAVASGFERHYVRHFNKIIQGK